MNKKARKVILGVLVVLLLVALIVTPIVFAFV
ncbi:hypothetical protein MYTO111405_00875 [Mycoplasma todarodis]